MATDNKAKLNSATLNSLEKIENEALQEYIKKNDLRGEMENMMKPFFDKNRRYLPENPYPEITKRLRQTEVRFRWRKCLQIVNQVIDQNNKSFESSSSTIIKLVPMKLFNKVILSCSRPPPNNTNDSDDKANTSPTPEEPIKMYAFKNVMNGVSEIHWIESICALLKPILSPIETMMDQCSINKISLISSPIFFYNPRTFLETLASEHVAFSHLFPRHRTKSFESWPYFMANGQIEIYHHVGITSATFQKAVSVFAKFIQQQIYWISVSSKKAAQYRFFLKHLIVNDNNPHLWTFDEIKANRKKFETNIKHAVAQKHSIRLIFYCIAPDEALIFECICQWYFYFRDVKCIKIATASSSRRGNTEYMLQSQVQDTLHRKTSADWTSFSHQSYCSVYHSFFVHYDDIKLFIDLFKHLSSTLNNDTFAASFWEWQMQDWRRIIHNLDHMKYGAVLAYLYRFATLVDSTTFDKSKMEFKSTDEQQVFRDKVLHETRLALYGHGALFQGFMYCIDRAMDVLDIIYREIKEYEDNMKGSNTQPQRNIMEDVDHRVAGQWIHKVLLSIANRFDEICDFYYPLYSEYLHCIPRVKYLLNECVQLMPPWSDLHQMTTHTRHVLSEHLAEMKQMFDLIGDTLIRDDLFMCISTRHWVQQRRAQLKCAPPNLEYIPLNNVMVINDAMEYNIKTHKLPNAIAFEGTLLQYVMDTEMDRWFINTLFGVLSDSLVFNPFIKMVTAAQQMSFEFDSYKQSDEEICAQIINTDCIELISHESIDDIQHLYAFEGIYGYKSALSFVNSDVMRDLHQEVCSHIPTQIMVDHMDHSIPDHHIFLSLCGDITHYPYFDVTLHEMEVIQNVFISGSRFDETVETFARHCWNLAHHLFKSSSSVLFISLMIGNNKYHCDMIIKKSNYQNALKMLIQCAKSRQSIAMELMMTSNTLKKYISVKLNIFLIYCATKTNRYRLCWPFRSDVIFATIFFDVSDAIKFWKAYSVGNISSEYNLEHKDYKKELIHQLQLLHGSAHFDAYFHAVLSFKALNDDCNGVIEIYRFFDANTLCGKCIETLQQLTLTQKLLNYRKASRYIKNQMNRQVISTQIKEAIAYSKKIIFSDLLTFFDRAMLTYLRTYYDLYDAVDDEANLYSTLNRMIQLLVPVRSASAVTWSTCLIHKNKDMLHVA
eukprot:217168_1